MQNAFIKNISVIAVSLLITPFASARPTVGGVYPLAQGFYVANGGDCASPANAWLREYNGKGISGAATHDCVAEIVDKHGNTYTVDQICTDAGTGVAPKSSERQNIIVQNANHFTQIAGGKLFSYHYCTFNQLPSDLRKNYR
ncbi:hypothetical protein [Massilia phyllosphaerae]|uniref:hypothetical protein n=1 Tax=Massilia phyllosphaerae TaxID=3106034 RepID=UPI002B1CCFA8|nr:hypothetical protein [Massilia sp. SGZ-792]